MDWLNFVKQNIQCFTIARNTLRYIVTSPEISLWKISSSSLTFLLLVNWQTCSQRFFLPTISMIYFPNLACFLPLLVSNQLFIQLVCFPFCLVSIQLVIITYVLVILSLALYKCLWCCFFYSINITQSFSIFFLIVYPFLFLQCNYNRGRYWNNYK